MSRTPIVAGNWKMFKSASESLAYLKHFIPLIPNPRAEVMLAVPFLSIQAVHAAVKNTPITVGAQNMHDAEEGAFTGEVSAKMIKEAGAGFVLLGHSERRQFFHESNAFVNSKLKRALLHRIAPVVCFGESLQERETGKTEKVLHHQLKECLDGLTPNQMEKVILAYEPIWAIGTGKTATPDMAQEAHYSCRQFLVKHWGAQTADQVRILYGGSVKPETIAALVLQTDIDGALVGGASLDPRVFATMVNEI